MPSLDELKQAFETAARAAEAAPEGSPQKAQHVEAAKHFAAEYARASQGPAPAQAGPSAPASAAGAPTGTPGKVPTRSDWKDLVTKGLPQVGAESLKMATSLATFPGEALRAGVNQLAGDAPDFGRGTQMIHDAIDSVIPPPETKSGKYGVRLGAGALNAAGLARAGVGTFSRNLLADALGTAGGEVGGALGQNVAGDNGRVIGGFLGAVAGGSPAAIPKGKGNYRQMLAEAIQGLEPGDFAQAARIAAEAKRHGIPLTPEQLFSNSSGLDKLVREVLASGAGPGKLQQIVTGQPDVVLAAAKNKGADLGANPGDSVARRDIRTAAEGAIKDAGTTPSNIRRLFEGKEAYVSGPEIEKLTRSLQNLESVYRGSDETVAMIRNLRERLGRVTEKESFDFGTKTGMQKGSGVQKWKAVQEPNSIEVVTGAFPQEVDLVVHSVEKLLKDLTINTPAMERLMTGRVGGAVAQVKQMLDDIISTRPQGRELYRARKEQEEQLKAGLTGRIAGRTGVNEALPDPKATITGNLLTDEKQDRDIAELAAALRARAKRAASEGETEAAAQATRALPQAMRVLWDRAVGNAFANTSGSRTPFNGAVLADTLIGTPNKQANFRQAMMDTGQALGKDPMEFATGMESFLRVLRHSSNNRTGMAFGTGEAAESTAAALSRAAPKVAATTAVSPAWGVVTAARETANKLAQVAKRRQYEQLSNLFADPDAVELIAKLGKAPLGSARAGAIINALMAGTAGPVLPQESDNVTQ